MASVRDKGRCPCPRCLIPLAEVDKMGTALDMRRRKTLARMDDEIKRFKVATARVHIYERNVAVDNDAVENLLAGESLVPTNVSDPKNLKSISINKLCKERFLRAFSNVRVQYILGAGGRSHARI